MPDMLGKVLLFLLFPIAAVILGGVVAAFKPPGRSVRSGIQHLAAGVVFAAVSIELLPDMIHDDGPVPAIIGFSVGLLLMLGVKEFAARIERNDKGGEGAAGGEASVVVQRAGVTKWPLSLLITVAVDLLIDGLLVGIGFAAGAKQGVLITIALSLEVLFIGLSAAATLTKLGATRQQVIMIPALLGFLIGVGGLGGALLLGGLTGAALEFVLAFGAAALLYLVIEELLIEAHEARDTPLATAAFFIGFLMLFAIDAFA